MYDFTLMYSKDVKGKAVPLLGRIITNRNGMEQRISFTTESQKENLLKHTRTEYTVEYFDPVPEEILEKLKSLSFKNKNELSLFLNELQNKADDAPE